MTPSELLLALAALLSSLSGAILAFVIWAKRPRYRRGRRSLVIFEGASSSAPPVPSPSRPDEGASQSFRPPRTWTDMRDVPVADVEDDAGAGGAGVPQKSVL